MKMTRQFAPIVLIIESEEELYVLRHLMAMGSELTIRDWFMADDHNREVIDFEKVQDVRQAFDEKFELLLDKVFTEPEAIPKGLKK